MSGRLLIWNGVVEAVCDTGARVADDLSSRLEEALALEDETERKLAVAAAIRELTRRAEDGDTIETWELHDVAKRLRSGP